MLELQEKESWQDGVREYINRNSTKDKPYRDKALDCQPSRHSQIAISNSSHLDLHNLRPIISTPRYEGPFQLRDTKNVPNLLPAPSLDLWTEEDGRLEEVHLLTKSGTIIL